MLILQTPTVRFVLAAVVLFALGLGTSGTAQAQSLTDPQANVVGTFSIDGTGALTVDGFVRV